MIQITFSILHQRENQIFHTKIQKWTKSISNTQIFVPVFIKLLQNICLISLDRGCKMKRQAKVDDILSSE